jgi:hypothetical protein
MPSHKLGALVCVGITTQLLVGVASATTFTAGVDPATPGSVQKPQTHNTSINFSKIDPGPGGNAKSPLTTMVDSLPADFAATLSHYSSCSPNVVVHGDKQPNCPNRSVLGSAAAVAYLPAFAFSTTSDQGYIFKINANTIRVWVHVSKPIAAGVVVEGKLTQGVSPFGPVITWDFTPLADGAQTGTEVRVNRVDFSFQRATTPRHARTSTAFAPFVSAGCSTGKWPFQAQLTFADKTTETHTTSVRCAKTASDF